MYDIKITNGTIVDGTGRPSYPGDVGITRHRLVDVGRAPDGARVELDATGKVICPGIIDAHTHYDAQVFWDRMMTISPWHGVTTTVLGHCGFGIAPTRRDDRERILRMMRDVEGMPLGTTVPGLGPEWGFETFPEFMDAIEGLGTVTNTACYVPHNPVRMWVMGEEAAARYPTDDELRAMQQIVREAMAVGAVGFSTTDSPGHTGDGGHPVASRVSTYEEFLGFARVLGELKVGVFQTTWGATIQAHTLVDIIARTGVTGVDPGIAARGKGTHGQDVRDNRMAWADWANTNGLRWYPEINFMPNTFEVGLDDPFMFALDQPGGAIGCTPLHELFGPIVKLDTVDERHDVYRQPGFRDRFIHETDRDDWNAHYWPWVIVNYAPKHSDLEGRMVLEIAEERGLKPGAVLFDLCMDSDLEARFGVISGNRDREAHMRLLMSDNYRVGLTDAGAHQGQICDARYPTYVLGRWVREQEFPLTRAIAMMTGMQAQMLGLLDRGLLTPGLAADVMVFDPDTVIDGPITRVNDLPGNGRRLVSDGLGIDYVVVNGTVIRDHGADAVDADGPLPGRMLRDFARHGEWKMSTAR